MFPPALSARLDALIDELILDGGVEAASLASIFLAAKESVRREYHVSLSRWVWAAANEFASSFPDEPGSAGAGPHSVCVLPGGC